MSADKFLSIRFLGRQIGQCEQRIRAELFDVVLLSDWLKPIEVVLAFAYFPFPTWQ